AIRNSMNVDTLYVAYADHEQAASGECPTAPCVSGNCFPTTPMKWYMSYSFNEGVDWGNELLAEDAAWPLCVTNNGKYGRANRNRPAWAVDTKIHHCFIGINKSSPTGALVHVIALDDTGMLVHDW